jgi:hypothetical protein
MRIVAAFSISVGLLFVLACGGAPVDSPAVALEGPVMVLPQAGTTAAPSPEAIQPDGVESDREEDVVPAPAAGSDISEEMFAVADATDELQELADASEEVEAVNKPTETPAPASAPAPAPVAVGVGQIQLTTGAGIQPVVDGVPMRLTTSQGFLSEVSTGKHSREIRNLLGNVTGSAEVDVLDGRRTRYEWRRRSLSLLGDVASSPMPSAVDWDEVFATDDAGSTASGDKQPLQPAPAAVIDKK